MSKIRDLVQWNRSSPVSVQNGFSIASLQDEMNRMFEHFYNGMQVRLTDWDALPEGAPAINIAEASDSFKVEAALPGVEPKNVTVEVAGGILTIRGEKKEEREEKRVQQEGTYLRKEIACGSFLRTVALPETADSGKAKAEFRNGILTVTVPKKAEAVQKPRKIEVKEAA
jgi:HSP20 family protein